jgi:outer membrane protein OmpA-like peptidoglycan-associated protein
MKKTSLVLLSILILCLASVAPAQQQDARDCKDHPLFTRMPGYWIHSCQEKQFDAFAFVTGKGQTVTVEGHFWRFNYYPQATLASKPSDLQIQRNFQNAVQQQGGKVVWTEKGRDTYKLVKDGQEIWVQLAAEFTGKYFLTIVQKQGMVQDIVANAAALAQGLNAEGHMTVEGIYFDTGKSTIKPESAKAIEEIAKLLQADPALKVFVVGHTDGVSTVEVNLKLSQDRAQAVLQALVGQHGINPARLRAYGCGPFAPVATNDTDEGRAKNRRVELVKQ